MSCYIENKQEDKKHEDETQEIKEERDGSAGSNNGWADGLTFSMEYSRKIQETDKTPKSVSAAIEMISAKRRDIHFGNMLKE